MIKTDLLIAFFNNIDTLEERKKAYAKDAKESFDAFAKNNGVSAKSLKRAYKDYKDYQKDKNAFVEVDTEASALLEAVVPEYQDREAA